MQPSSGTSPKVWLHTTARLLSAVFVTVGVVAVGIVVVPQTTRSQTTTPTTAAAELTISVADVSVLEGDSGLTDMVFTAKLSGSPTHEVRIHATAWRRRCGTAIGGSGPTQDFLGFRDLKLVFPANASGTDLSKTVTVKVKGDQVVEGNETLTFLLNNLRTEDPRVAFAVGRTRRPSRSHVESVGTIIDDDADGVVISMADACILEGARRIGEIGEKEMPFTVTLNGTPTHEVRLRAAARGVTATGSAGAGRDFIEFENRNVVFPANASGDDLIQTVTVTVLSDLIDESDETFTLLLNNLQTDDARVAFHGGGKSQLEASGTIWDDDEPGASGRSTTVAPTVLPPRVHLPEVVLPVVPDTWVVKFWSVSATTPGVYTVDWVTVGGCEPSRKSASGVGGVVADPRVGSRSAVVAVPAGVASSATVSSPGVAAPGFELALVAATHCDYKFNVTYESNLPGDAGKSCVVHVTSPAKPDGKASFVATYRARTATIGYNLVVQTNKCTEMAAIHVVVGPSPSTGESATFRDPDGAYQVSDPTVGAVLSSSFLVSATPIMGSDEGCKPVSIETQFDRNDTFSRNDDKVFALLRVVKQTLPSESGAICQYAVVTGKSGLPVGFVAVSAGSTESIVEAYQITPTAKIVPDGPDSGIAPDFVDTSVMDCGRSVVTAVGADNRIGGADDTMMTVSGPVCLTHYVKVAKRDVYVTQSVIGDSGGGKARYSLTESKDCGHATSPSVSTVALHEGSYNVTRTVLGPTGSEDADGRFGASRFALNSQAEQCEVTVAVSHLPAGCTAAATTQQSNLATDVDAKNRAMMRFDITCPAASGGDMGMEPPADVPTG